MKKSLLLILAFFLLLIAPLMTARATDRVWTGSSGDSNWFNSANWNPSAVPGADDSVVISNSAFVILSNDTAALEVFTITNATLTFTNWTTTLNASNVTVQSEATLTLPAAFTTNQMSNCVHIVCTNFVLNSGGTIDANGKGYRGGTTANGSGPGKGLYGPNSGSGAGHGGNGGMSSDKNAGGSAYGLTNTPVTPGSGGGGGAYGATGAGGNGGGIVRIEASGTVTADGTISANGNIGGITGGAVWGGCGAGGSIFIMCQAFGGGAGGVLQANGGSGAGYTAYSGGGGGGRIAVAIGLSEEARNKLLNGEEISRLYTYKNHAAYAGTISVTNGDGMYNPPSTNAAYPGTMLFLTTNYCLTITGNPANYGSPTPHAYGTHIDIPEDSSVTNSVSSPVDQASGMRHTCFGWNLDEADGSSVSNAATTQAVFQLTTNLVLTWNWTNEYELTVSAATTNGIVNTNVNGWYTNGVEVSEISAAGTNGYIFLVWTGDVPLGQETNNPLSVTMDQPRTIQGNFCSLAGEPKAWTGSGNWISATNWSPTGIPGPYDDAVIESGTLTLSDSRQTGTLAVSNNATLMFTNWTATLTASNVTVLTNGTITIPPAFTTNQMSNCVHIVCTNFTVETGGAINVDSKGFARDCGPGKGGAAGSTCTGGGGHGGRGGNGLQYAGGSTNGLAASPILPGSGGGSYQSGGGAGGGAVRIEVSDTATVDGTISACGGNYVGNYSGGGSGGSIFLTCGTFAAGANGFMRADGGNGHAGYGGGGSGGRIAVVYDTLIGTPSMVFSARPGLSCYNFHSVSDDYDAELGTLYFPNTNMLSETISTLNGRLVIPGFTNWSPTSLTISNCWVGTDGVDLSVGGDLLVTGAGAALFTGTNTLTCEGNVRLSGAELGCKGDLSCIGNLVLDSATNTFKWGNRTLHCGGGVVITNGGKFYFYSGMTNGLSVDYGGLVSVTGDVSIGGSSWIYPASHSTDGGSVLFRMNNLTISTNGGFNADGRGYAGGTGNGYPGYGPGGGHSSGNVAGGGGYGGKGGDGQGTTGREGGSTYGSTNAPCAPGSGGAGTYSYKAGNGGGLVRIEATGFIMADGTIMANGASGGSGHNGGGSGGGIFIMCNTFAGGSNGVLQADGGIGAGDYGGGGGGGRIAVWYAVPEDRRQGIREGTDMRRVATADEYSEFSGAVYVTNGTDSSTSADGEPGTIVFLTVTPPSGTMFMCK